MIGRGPALTNSLWVKTRSYPLYLSRNIIFCVCVCVWARDAFMAPLTVGNLWTCLLSLGSWDLLCLWLVLQSNLVSLVSRPVGRRTRRRRPRAGRTLNLAFQSFFFFYYLHAWRCAFQRRGLTFPLCCLPLVWKLTNAALIVGFTLQHFLPFQFFPTHTHPSSRCLCQLLSISNGFSQRAAAELDFFACVSSSTQLTH